MEYLKGETGVDGTKDLSQGCECLDDLAEVSASFFGGKIPSVEEMKVSFRKLQQKLVSDADANDSSESELGSTRKKQTTVYTANFVRNLFKDIRNNLSQSKSQSSKPIKLLLNGLFTNDISTDSLVSFISTLYTSSPKQLARFYRQIYNSIVENQFDVSSTDVLLVEEFQRNNNYEFCFNIQRTQAQSFLRVLNTSLGKTRYQQFVDNLLTVRLAYRYSNVSESLQKIESIRNELKSEVPVGLRGYFEMLFPLDFSKNESTPFVSASAGNYSTTHPNESQDVGDNASARYGTRGSTKRRHGQDVPTLTGAALVVENSSVPMAQAVSVQPKRPKHIHYSQRLARQDGQLHIAARMSSLLPSTSTTTMTSTATAAAVPSQPKYLYSDSAAELTEAAVRLNELGNSRALGSLIESPLLVPMNGGVAAMTGGGNGHGTSTMAGLPGSTKSMFNARSSLGKMTNPAGTGSMTSKQYANAHWPYAAGMGPGSVGSSNSTAAAAPAVNMPYSGMSPYGASYNGNWYYPKTATSMNNVDPSVYSEYVSMYYLHWQQQQWLAQQHQQQQQQQQKQQPPPIASKLPSYQNSHQPYANSYNGLYSTMAPNLLANGPQSGPQSGLQTSRMYMDSVQHAPVEVVDPTTIASTPQTFLSSYTSALLPEISPSLSSTLDITTGSASVSNYKGELDNNSTFKRNNNSNSMNSNEVFPVTIDYNGTSVDRNSLYPKRDGKSPGEIAAICSTESAAYLSIDSGADKEQVLTTGSSSLANSPSLNELSGLA